MLADKLRAATSVAVAVGGEAWSLTDAHRPPGSDPADTYGVGNLTDGGNIKLDIFFKPDGTKVYTVARGTVANRVVAEYDLAIAWGINTVSFLQSFSISAQEINGSGLFFKPDGTKMYVTGYAGDDVNEYNLGTAWDISTASFLQLFSVAAQETNPNGIFFKPDGTKMYITGSIGDDVNEYDLGTAWDISTASFLQLFSVAAQETSPEGIFFKPDGTKMYVVGTVGRDVNEYDLSTAWDISTASFLQVFSVAAQATQPRGISFKTDGTYMYIHQGKDVYGYILSTAWDVSSAAWDEPIFTEFFDVTAQETTPSGAFFKPDGAKMYVVGGSDEVNEYNLSTAWDINTASFLQVFSVAAQETSPEGIFFKPDGTKMYVVGTVGDDVNEYNLGTAWNVSTSSFVQAFSVAAQVNSVCDVFFKPDGLVMYVLDGVNRNVNQYSLSTAWNISTASYVQLFNPIAQETSPQGIFFKPDGTKMYITGRASDTAIEYDLGTAWDVTTASFVQSFSVAVQALETRSISFKTDGTEMFILDATTRSIWRYTLV